MHPITRVLPALPVHGFYEVWRATMVSLRAFVCVGRASQVPSMFRILARSGFILSLCVMGLCVTAPARADVEEIVKQIQREGHARVILRMKSAPGAAPWSAREPASRQRAAVAAALDNVQPTLRIAGIRAVKTFRTLPFVAATVDRAQLLDLLAAPDVESVSLVRVERKAVFENSQIASSVPSVDVRDAWAQGFDGTGYAVAVIDGGFNLSHPMLQGKAIGDACFGADFGTTTRNNCPSGVTPQIGPGAASNCPPGSDRCDHATHVASVAVGNDGVNFGVARGAKLVPIDVFSVETDPTVCGPDDTAPCELTDSETVLDALDYVNEHAAAYKIAAVNISIGGSAREGYCDDDKRKGVIDMLRQKGIAVAIAASNGGLTGQVTAPACISSALGVGATNDGTTVAAFSNFSPILDFVAPGVGIMAASGSGNGVVSSSGTSVAAPHVAGAWAVMRQAFPALSFEQIETALKQTGIPVTRLNSGVTIPKIQIASAISRLQGKDKRVFNNIVASSAPGLGQSFLRFFNNSPAAGTVTVTLRDAGTGATLGSWTSGAIAPQASPQIALDVIERDAVPIGAEPIVSAARLYYNIDVTSTFTGYMQHVLWARFGGVFANLSSCASGFADDSSVVINAHASAIGSYISRLRLVNTGANADHALLRFFDPVTGVELAQWTSPDIAPGASLEVTSPELEGLVPLLGVNVIHNAMLQYNVRLSNLTGYLQHVVENAAVGALVDMSSKCDLGVAQSN